MRAIPSRDTFLDTVECTVGRCRIAMDMIAVASLQTDLPTDSPYPRLDQLMGLASTDTPPAHAIALRGGGHIAICGPVVLKRLAAYHIHALPVLVSARQRLRGVRALGLDADGPILIIDPGTLLQRPQDIQTNPQP